MSKTVVVRFEQKEISCLIDYLLEDLRVWSEKDFESKEEEESFQRMACIVSKLREANEENELISI